MVSFAEIAKKNAENKKRLERERKEANRKVKLSYSLNKPKKEKK